MTKKAIVSGGSAGLGLACATALAANGLDVVLCARNKTRLESAASALRASFPGVEITVLQWDLEDSVSTHQSIGQIIHERVPDIFVHVAGGPPIQLPCQESEDTFRRQLQSHSFSLLEAMRSFVPTMQDRGFGRIIAIMSRAVAEPRGDNPLSAAIRLPAWAMMKSYASSGRFPAVTFNALLPGLFATERFEDVCHRMAEAQGTTPAQARERLLRDVPTGRLGRPEELGALCAYLASDLGGYVNGQRLIVDGGSTAGL